MNQRTRQPRGVLIVAVPETAGSALYGMLDVLSVAGTIWQQLTRSGAGQRLFSVGIVSPLRWRFTCGNGVPISPDAAIVDDPAADIVILPELWLGPDQSIQGRYGALIEWVRRRHETGAALYSACSGTVMLAETGLLDGCPATSHWAYADLFQRRRTHPSGSPGRLIDRQPAGRALSVGAVLFYGWCSIRMVG